MESSSVQNMQPVQNASMMQNLRGMQSSAQMMFVPMMPIPQQAPAQAQGCMVKNTFIHFNGDNQVDHSQQINGIGSQRREFSEPPRRAPSGSSDSFKGTDDSEEDENARNRNSIRAGNRQVSDSAALARSYQSQGQFLLFPAQQNAPSGQISGGHAPATKPSLNPQPQMEKEQQLQHIQQLQLQQQQLQQQHQSQVQQLQQQQQIELLQLQLQIQGLNFMNNDGSALGNNADDEDSAGRLQPGQNQAMQFLASSSGSTPAALAQAWMSQMSPGSQNPEPGRPRTKPQGRSQGLMKTSADTGSTPEPGPRPAGKGGGKGENRRDQVVGSRAMMENTAINRDDEDANGTVEGNDQSKRRPIDPHAWENGVVTIMVRQLPRQYTQRMFLQEVVRRGFEGLFDFIYLPYDFKNGNNVGYGFINFTSPEYAVRFRDSLDGQYLDKYMRMKSKAVRVHPAQVQGYEANYRHFAHTKTGQKQDPAFSPLFFPVPKDAAVLELLKQLQTDKDMPPQSGQRGETTGVNSHVAKMRGPSSSGTSHTHVPSRPLQLDRSGETSHAQDSHESAVRQRLVELQQMERQLLEESMLQQELTPGMSLSNFSDFCRAPRESQEQKPKTKRIGRQQQLPLQQLGMSMLPVGMHDGQGDSQASQHMQHFQQMQQQLLAYSPEMLGPCASGWFPQDTSSIDHANAAPQPGLTFGWMRPSTD